MLQGELRGENNEDNLLNSWQWRHYDDIMTIEEIWTNYQVWMWWHSIVSNKLYHSSARSQTQNTKISVLHAADIDKDNNNNINSGDGALRSMYRGRMGSISLARTSPSNHEDWAEEKCKEGGQVDVPVRPEEGESNVKLLVSVAVLWTWQIVSEVITQC